MARRSSTTTKNAEADAAVATEEAPVSTDSTATPEATASTEAPIDLGAFNSAVESAVADADSSTGEIPPASLELVVAEYRKLDGAKGKNAAKRALNEGMKSAMNESDIVKARSFLNLTESMTSGSSARAEREPADPTESAAQRIATLQLARDWVVVPEGVSDELDSKVEALISESTDGVRDYLAYLQADEENRGDEPDVSAVVKNAAKLALGKNAKAGGRASTGGSFSGERRDIGKHILQAFEGVEVGTFLTVAEIRKFVSDEYGTDSPSAGAISARLFPQGDGSKCSLIEQGIQPDTNEKGNKGARKTA
jgi:hypothetical protein